MKRKRIMALLSVMLLLVGLIACGGEPASPEKEDVPAKENVASNGEKKDLVMMINSPDSPATAPIEEAIRDKFGDKYNLIFKEFTTSSTETLKTAGIAGEQVDLSYYWVVSMRTLLDSGVVMPLDEYADAWKDYFVNEEVMRMGTYDAQLVILPFESVYPLVLVNKDIADRVGFELSEDGNWTWEEFCEFCALTMEKEGIYGSAVFSDWAAWMTRQGMMQVWDTDEEVERFNSGQVSYLDDKVVGAFDMVKDAIESDYLYPGADAALAQTLDQVYAAMAGEKVASMFIVNSSVVGALESTGLENYKIMEWPNMGNNPNPPLLGGATGLFIPSMCKNLEGALEVMDFLLSEECANIRAENGVVSTLKTSDDFSVDPQLMTDISRSTDQLVGSEIHNLHADLDTLTQQMPANYLSYGIKALEEMEAIRRTIGEE